MLQSVIRVQIFVYNAKLIRIVPFLQISFAIPEQTLVYMDAPIAHSVIMKMPKSVIWIQILAFNVKLILTAKLLLISFATPRQIPAYLDAQMIPNVYQKIQKKEFVMWPFINAFNAMQIPTAPYHLISFVMAVTHALKDATSIHNVHPPIKPLVTCRQTPVYNVFLIQIVRTGQFVI